MNIIAEIGWNHLGDMHLAEKMIESAKKAGATVAKFQLWDPAIMKRGDWDQDGRFEIYKKAKLNDERILLLSNICKKNNIEILFSAFGTVGAKRLLDLGFTSIKIPSHEIANKKLIKFCAENFSKILISSGASNLNEVIEANNILKNNKEINYNLMHCVSSYPCEVSQINLPRLNTLKKFHNNIGLSDHTSSVIVPSLTVSYGVSVIEKHFTIDNNLEGRDNKFALNTNQFELMVKNILIAKEANISHGDNFQIIEKDIINNYRGRWEPKDYY